MKIKRQKRGKEKKIYNDEKSQETLD